MHDDEVHTDAVLVGPAGRGAFPHWAGLPVTAVPSAGTDNALYRLGDEMAWESALGSRAWEHPPV